MAPQPAPSVGVAKPNRMLPSEASTSAAGGTRPAKKSPQISRDVVAWNSFAKGGPSAGLIQQRMKAYDVNKVASRMPGRMAAANSVVTGTSSTGPMTTSMMLGGMRMPSVPPAVIRPDDSLTS